MPTADETFLKTARQRFKLADDAVKAQRMREIEDLRFYAGDQWDSDILKSRQGQTIGSGSVVQVVPARPCLTINKTREPVRQVLNSERQSDLGIELIPADDWGEATGPIDHTEIELREGLVRRIQRDSEASDARTWAFARSSIAGTGYWLVMTRYAPGKSQDQDVYIERIYNQSTVLLDPSHEQPDGSDAQWGFWGKDMLWSEFEAEYGQSKLAKRNPNDQEWRSMGDDAPGWFTLAGSGDDQKRSMRVMNYVYTTSKPVEVYHLTNGGAAYDEELVKGEDGTRVLATDPTVAVMMEDGKEVCHTDSEKVIKWAKITGNEILDQTDWAGHWLPIIQTVGEELQPYDQERRREGIVRPMRDSCMGNNYVVSKFVERVGLTPIPPIMMAGGQDEGFEAEWDAANTRTFGRLHYNQKDQFQQPAPPPYRADSRAEITDIGMGLQLFSQAIASTSVTPETALGNADPTVKSGKLAKMLLEQAERGTSNFLDNLVRSMRHEARVINDLLFPIYGRPGRLARMMNGQGEMSTALIGQPFRMEGVGKQAKPVPAQEGDPQAKTYKLTKDANFNVAVKVSKNFETRRQQISQTLAELIGADPSQMLIIGDILWKYFDLPDHEAIEKRYKVMLAPPIQAMLDGNSPLPPEAQQKIAMLEQQLQQVMPLADKNMADLEKVKIQESEETKRTHIKQMGDDARTRADNETKLAVAELGAKMDRLALFLEERARLGVQMQEGTESELTRQHEREMAAQEHQQALEQGQQQTAGALVEGEQGQQHALEQGEQGHAQALDQAAQQAALQPSPADA